MHRFASLRAIHVRRLSAMRCITVAPPQSTSNHGEQVDENGVRQRPFGTSKADVDAFGHTDAFAAIRESIEKSNKESEFDALKEDIDEATSAVNRRRNRKKKTMDHVLGEVLEDALRMRDMGKKPDMDFIYKQTQERVYEAEHGQKPPSQKDRNAKYVPFPPDHNLNRILPSTLFDDDPWPERSITRENPVMSHNEMERDKHSNGGRLAKSQEAMFLPRDGRDPVAEFVDAVDELSHWELKLIEFVRDVPVSQRRTLPLLHETYRALTHRVIRAEKRFITTRDYALPKAQPSSEVFKRTEDRVERVRASYAAIHKSLSSPNYDPIVMKNRDVVGHLMSLSPEQFDAWKQEETNKRNLLISEFSGGS